MDVEEYLTLEQSHDEATRQNVMQNEMLKFVNVWTKSRQPELYQELTKQFEDMENQIYAQRECESSRNDAPAF
jgi:hypothetical protein